MDSGDYFPGLCLQVVFSEPAISSVIPFISVFILLCVVAFLSAGEQVLFALSSDEINHLKEDGNIKNKIIKLLFSHRQLMRHIYIVQRIAIYTAIMMLGIYGIRSFLLESIDAVSVYLSVAVTFFIIFYLFDGILPRFIVKYNLLRITTGTTPISKDPDEQEMIEEIHDFYHKTADEIMIPRLDMTAIDVRCDINEILDIVIKTGFSRIPIYEDSEDNITGVLYVKDLLPAVNHPESIQWQNLIRPAYFVPENKKIDDLLEEFRTNKIHIAIVVDEFGCTSGLVTLEDIIEEIVGEISDEYDRDKQHFLRLPDGSYIVEGKIQLNDFFRETAIDEDDFENFPEEVDTLAGLLLKIKGTLPCRREVIDYKQYRFKILEADERRVLKVKFSLIEPTPETKTGVPVAIGCLLLLSGVLSCSGSVPTPKPKGFYRIEIPEAQYINLSLDDLPYSFNVSQFVTVELPFAETADDWINLAYPALNAKMYCSYLPITSSADLSLLEEECRELVARNVRNADAITEQMYENQELRVFGMVFRIEGETASPVQFMLTDSISRFFRGALFYENKPNVDSLAPVTEFLYANVIELIQSFRWKE